MNTPLVSFCTPTYNRPEFLRRTVESCLAQTCQDFEIIITDNSTNDESARMVAKFNDPRIRYFSNNGNIGSFKNYEKAVSMARGRGKYVQILADDDLIKPKFLELMIDAFEKNPSVGVVMAPMDLIDENDRRIFPKFYFIHTMHYRYRYQVGDGLVERKRVLRDFLTGQAGDYPCCVPTGILYRAEAFWPALPFDAEADFAGDLDLCMKIAPYWDFYYIDQVLSSWRYTPTNHTARLHKEGLPIHAFYYVTRRCLGNKTVQDMFRDEWEKLSRDSLLFCSWRSAVLNGLAAIRARSPKLLMNTVKTIYKEDPYRTNFLRLPIWAVRHVVNSFFPPKRPPPRE
jgi:glycosyltransferase involved in cell wall biosynthesis